MFVVRNFATFSHSKPISVMFIRLVVVNGLRRQAGEQKGKELLNRVCIDENILITNFVFIQIFFLF
jgi:ABC-type polar amino acid transport system ATPase subunit